MSLQSLINKIVGNVAHDRVDVGNPVKVGGKAVEYGTNPTSVAANDRTNWNFTRSGMGLVRDKHPNEITFRVQYTAAQTNTAIISVSSGTRIMVTGVQVKTNAFNPNIFGYIIGFGATTTPTGTGVVDAHPGCIPGASSDDNCRGGIGGDGEDLRITCDDPGTGSEVDVLVSYYTETV